MRRLPRRLPPRTRLLAVGLCLLVVTLVAYQLLPTAYGAQLGHRRLLMSSADAGATAEYLLSFDIVTPGPLGSIIVQFCSNTPIAGDPCTAPIGMDVSSVAMPDQTGETGFSIDPATTANQIVLSRTVAASAVGPVSYHFTGAINPSNPGSYYARLQTFATNDASGPASDYGGIAFAIVNFISLTATVPPYLIFCTGITITGLNCVNAVGNYIDFGELLITQASSASSQMLIATNSGTGYTISVYGTTLASGINAIVPLNASDVSRPGVSQFGFNLRTNSTPPDGSEPFGPGVAQPTPAYNQPDVYTFNSGDTLVSHPVPDNVRQFTISYIVNRPVGQAPGIYVSTLTYIALATF